MGIHFMNPVPLMELVEHIRGIATDDPTFTSVKQFASNPRQDHRGRGGFPRFIVNRILLPMINEAVYNAL